MAQTIAYRDRDVRAAPQPRRRWAVCRGRGGPAVFLIANSTIPSMIGAEHMETMMKSKLALGFSSALLASALIAPAVAVHGQEGAAARAGEALDNAGRSIRRGVENAVSRTRASVQEQGVLARVYSRIHWDKMLVGSTLELEMREDGTAILRGGVPTKAAKDRAIVLARDTVGVTRVIDELVLPPNVRVVPAPPATASPTGVTTISKPARVVPAPTTVTETTTTIEVKP